MAGKYDEHNCSFKNEDECEEELDEEGYDFDEEENEKFGESL